MKQNNFIIDFSATQTALCSTYQVIQARHQRVWLAWNLRTLHFELRVISYGCFLIDEYSAPVEDKTNRSHWILEFVLYIDCSVFSLVIYKCSKEWKMSSNCPKYLVVIRSRNHKTSLTKHYVTTAQTFNDPSCILTRVKWNSCSIINRFTDWED